MSAVPLPVPHRRPGRPARFRNSEDSRFVRFLGRSHAGTFVFHCEVLTPQVRRRPRKPGLPGNCRAGAAAPSPGRPRKLTVVITLPVVTGRYCGKVTRAPRLRAIRQVTASLGAGPGRRPPAAGPAGPADGSWPQLPHPRCIRPTADAAPTAQCGHAGLGNSPGSGSGSGVSVAPARVRPAAPLIGPAGHLPAVYEFPR